MKKMIAKFAMKQFKDQFLQDEVWDAFDRDCFNKSLPDLIREYPLKHPLELELFKNKMAQKFACYIQDLTADGEESL